MENASSDGSDFNIHSIEEALERESSMDEFFEAERQESIVAGKFILDTLRQHKLISQKAESYIDAQDTQLTNEELYYNLLPFEQDKFSELGIDDPSALFREMGIIATLSSAYLLHTAGGPEQIRAELEADLIDSYKLTDDEYTELRPVLDKLFDGKPGLRFDNIESYTLFEKTHEENTKRQAVQVLKTEITPLMAELFAECMEEGLVPQAHDDLKELFSNIANTLHYERVHGVNDQSALLLKIRWENIRTLAGRMGLDEATLNTVSDRMRIAYEIY